MAGDENAIGMTRLVEKKVAEGVKDSFNWRNPAVHSQLEPIFKDSEVQSCEMCYENPMAVVESSASMLRTRTTILAFVCKLMKVMLRVYYQSIKPLRIFLMTSPIAFQSETKCHLQE